MSLVNLPSMGVVRAQSYYLLLPVICFAMPVNAGLAIILLGPALYTIVSGWKKYENLRPFILISCSVGLLLSILATKEIFASVFIYALALLPICSVISFKTKKQKGDIR